MVNSDHFYTERLQGQRLCFLKSVWGFSSTVCNHSAIKTLSIVRDKLKCPHEDKALALYVVCDNKDSKARFEEVLCKKEEEETRAFFEQNIEPTQTCIFELRVDQSDWISFSFIHFLLCKYNGMLRLGWY